MTENYVIGVKAKCRGCGIWLKAETKEQMKAVHEAHVKVCPVITALDKIASLGEDGDKLWQIMVQGHRQEELAKFLKRCKISIGEAREYLDRIENEQELDLA